MGELRHVVQVGVIVEEIEMAREAWARLLGVEAPPVVETESWESTHMRYEGRPSEGRAKLCFFQLGNLVVELIQPVGGPSTWQDFLDESGPGVHHLAFRVDDLEGALKRFAEIGISVEQQGEYKGGCYTYMGSKRKLGAIVEFLHAHS